MNGADLEVLTWKYVEGILFSERENSRTFYTGLIIYVSLLLLTPKILSLQSDPQVNAFLSWAHSYAAFHN